MITREDVGDVTILVESENDFLTDTTALKKMCSQLLEEGRRQVILDLQNVFVVTSVYLGGLLSVTKTFREKKGVLKLVHLQPAVSSVMEMTRLSRIIEVFNDRETAIKSFSQ
ncbi:MAG TPA: STAS domain-containing protein [bacterium]|nr:STAS domain-containing protein [bacterium]